MHWSSAGISVGTFFCPITCFHSPGKVAPGIATDSLRVKVNKNEFNTLAQIFALLRKRLDEAEARSKYPSNKDVRGLNLKKHCPQFPRELSETGQARSPEITPELRQHSHSSHDSIPFLFFFFVAKSLFQLHLVISLDIDLTGV